MLLRNYSFNKTLKLNYPKYYKYGFLLYLILKTKLLSNIYRKYINTCQNYLIGFPHFKLVKQIYLRENMFFTNKKLVDYRVTLPLNKKPLNKFYKRPLKHLIGLVNLPTGLNHFFLQKNTTKAPVNKFNESFKDTVLLKTYVLIYKNQLNILFLQQLNFEILFVIFLTNSIKLYQIQICLLCLNKVIYKYI